MTKTLLLVAVSALLMNVPWVLAAHRNERTGDAFDENRRAIVHICSTATVLDELVVAARNQIVANFENGTYEKLRRRGVLSDDNIAAAQATLVKYGMAHRKLNDNNACDEVADGG